MTAQCLLMSNCQYKHALRVLHTPGSTPEAGSIQGSSSACIRPSSRASTTSSDGLEAMTMVAVTVFHDHGSCGGVGVDE